MQIECGEKMRLKDGKIFINHEQNKEHCFHLKDLFEVNKIK